MWSTESVATPVIETRQYDIKRQKRSTQLDSLTKKLFVKPVKLMIIPSQDMVSRPAYIQRKQKYGHQYM